jgi:mannitol 2-dehydrogenase
MEDDTFVTYLRRFMDEEATPIRDELEGIGLNAYKDSLQERFANPNIKDSVSRICSESSAKLPKFLIATLQENLDSGGSVQYATLVIAAWCYYSDKGTDKNGQSIEIIDAMAAELRQKAQQTKADTLAFIKQESLFGDLSKNEHFAKCYSDFVQQIYKDGNIKALMQTMI